MNSKHMAVRNDVFDGYEKTVPTETLFISRIDFYFN